MAHVTFMRARLLPGHKDAVLELMRRWEREHGARARGFERSIIATGKNDPDDLMGAITWDNYENYMANANSPEQDRWYREMRSHMTGDPMWSDCDIIFDSKAAGVAH